MDITAICRTTFCRAIVCSLGTWCLWTLPNVEGLLLVRLIVDSRVDGCIFLVGRCPPPTENRSILDLNRGCVARHGSGLSSVFYVADEQPR
jgi:hypothetical protein